MTKTTVTNTSQGFRGLNAVDGYVELAPGESRDVELSDDERKSAEKVGYFALGGKAAKAAAAAAPVDTTAPLPNNVPKLKKIARDEGIELGTAKSTADIQAAIVAGRAAKAAAPGAAPAAPTPTPPTDELDKMSDADLAGTVQAITGKPAPEGADRETLLKLARGQ